MIHIYTGDGKGKTTASVGLAVRASKHMKVLFVQFMKDGSSAEIKTLEKLPNIDVRLFGTGNWVIDKDSRDSESKKVAEALKFIKKEYHKYGTIIVDEAIMAITSGVVDEAEVISLTEEISEKGHEIILTGRGLTRKFREKADLVTEMKKVKHYFDKGKFAREGIEF